MTITPTEYLLLSPELFMLTMACLILVVEAFMGERYRQISYVLSQLTLLVAALLSGNLIDTGAAVLLGGITIFEAVLLAAILAPTDAALGQAVVSSPRLPVRIRQTLNVESGLNDGIALPVVLLFLSCYYCTLPHLL